MRYSFEIDKFPDLSLPKYFDLFGEEALSVASSKLFSWFQMVACAHPKFSFSLRYVFDPNRQPSNCRLRIFVIVTTSEGSASEAVLMGKKMVQSALSVVEVSAVEAEPKQDGWHYTLLRRRDRVSRDGSDLVFLPAIWTRQASARNAMEPYVDEAFASLQAPAFLEIQLHGADANKVRQILRAQVKLMEKKRQSDAPAADEYVQHFSSWQNILTSDPTSNLLIFTGSPSCEAGQGLLQAFGVEALGGPSFETRQVAPGDVLHDMLSIAFREGHYEFAGVDGWYNPALPRYIASNDVQLSDPQVDALKGLSQLSVLGGSELIRDVLTLPIPRRGYLRSFPLETELSQRSSIVLASSQENFVVIGQDLERGATIALPIKDLTRHGFVAGVTGSGKTVTMFNILRQLSEQDIPFLVFEPAKTEYRRLTHFSSLQGKLQIYTPGRDDICPIRMNPFQFPVHVTLNQHIANIVAAFTCAFSLISPYPAILEEAIWKLYEQGGWQEDDFGSTQKPIPKISQLTSILDDVVDSFNYDAENTGRIKGIFHSKFNPMSRGSIGRIFDCQVSIPDTETLFRSVTVIELARLNKEQANLLTMFFMIRIREHLGDSYPTGDRPRLVLVLEEAHNLVPSVSDEVGNGEESSAQSEASRYITNMLAEMRALGLSILVVDQTPAAVSAQVVRNTNFKVAHRTVAKQDRETLADAMLMSPAHAELLGRLVPGQAYIYADLFYRPHLVQCSLPSGETRSFNAPLNERELKDWLCTQEWFKNDWKRRSAELKRRVEEASNISENVHRSIEMIEEDISNQEKADNPSIEAAEQLEGQKGQLLQLRKIASKVLEPKVRSFEIEFRALSGTNRIGRLDSSVKSQLKSLADAVANLSSH